jgi:hypothetical protein
MKEQRLYCPHLNSCPMYQSLSESRKFKDRFFVIQHIESSYSCLVLDELAAGQEKCSHIELLNLTKSISNRI